MIERLNDTTDEVGLFGNEAVVYNDLPYAVLNEAMDSNEASDFQAELNEIYGYYRIYDKGSKFTPEGSSGDYIPSSLRFKKVASLINKEARFMFSKAPEFTIMAKDDISVKAKEDISNMQLFLNNILKKNKFTKQILRAGKDCLIGKRIAVVVNFNEETGITLSFLDSLSFYYDKEDDEINMFSSFSIVKHSKSLIERRIFYKKFEKENGNIYLEEKMYDGSGGELETITERTKLDINFIPVVVIQNEGLLGDDNGESDVKIISEDESWYSKLANADIDAGRKGMNPIRYTVDMDSQSTASLSSSAGSYWDLHSDQNLDCPAPNVGIINVDMSYSSALDTTLKRIKSNMHEQLEIPDINQEMMQGVITSGKTIKALYWPLMVRCDEKLATWIPELENVAKMIIEGAKTYIDIAKVNMPDIELTDIDYIINITSDYPIPEDEEEERKGDMEEVITGVISKKTYLKKWKGMTDKEADEELNQLLKEKNMLESIDGNYVLDED